MKENAVQMTKVTKRFILIITFFLLHDFCWANIYWAKKVISFSSQWGIRAGAANQALEKPNAFPQLNQCQTVWRPLNKTNAEFIHVAFEQTINTQQLIFGNKASNKSLVKAIAFDEKGKEVWSQSFKPSFNDKKNQIEHIQISEKGIPINQIKLIFDHSGPFTGSIQIDFIGLSDNLTPFVPTVNLPDSIKFNHQPENLGENVNSKYIELLPFISPDGEKLYFSRRDDPRNIESLKDDIWVSTIDEKGNWQPAVNMGRPINNASYNYVYSISPDGNSMLIDDQIPAMGRPANGLSFIKKSGKGWSFPYKVNIDGYYNKSEFNEFSLVTTENTMLLSIERNEGFGSNDIWFSHKKADGQWTKPENLGEIINTASNESYPFIAPDGITLYFASQGFASYGDFDIYMSKRLDDTWKNWTEPINIGPVINSNRIDQNLVIPANGEYAYFVSDKNSLGLSDIFKIKLPNGLKPEASCIVKGKVINKISNKGIEAKIVYTNLKTGKIIGNASSNPTTGEYTLSLPTGEEYAFYAESEGYLSVEQSLNLVNQKSFTTVEQNLLLAPISVGQKITLNNLFFETGKWSLKQESYNELDRVVEILTKNPNLKIQINGHTDNVGKEEDNLKLSTKRAQEVSQYITSKGLKSDRVLYKGFGSTQGLKPNDSDTNKAINRRVELEVIGM